MEIITMADVERNVAERAKRWNTVTAGAVEALGLKIKFDIWQWCEDNLPGDALSTIGITRTEICQAFLTEARKQGWDFVTSIHPVYCAAFANDPHLRGIPIVTFLDRFCEK